MVYGQVEGFKNATKIRITLRGEVVVRIKTYSIYQSSLSRPLLHGVPEREPPTLKYTCRKIAIFILF